MAKLPDQTITTIFRLQQRLVALLDTATADVLDFLYRTIDQGEAITDASEASIQEIKRSWNLP